LYGPTSKGRGRAGKLKQKEMEKEGEEKGREGEKGEGR